jgi:DNA-binding transcriptional MerR regulator
MRRAAAEEGIAAMADASRGSLPPKLYFRIGEVAELVGVEPHVLRYWEREFRSIRPTKSAKGQRVYSRRDVENLMRVRELLYKEGFTIAGAKKKLLRAEPADAEPADAEVRRAVDEPDASDRAKTRSELLAMRNEIEAFLADLDLPPR